MESSIPNQSQIVMKVILSDRLQQMCWRINVIRFFLTLPKEDSFQTESSSSELKLEVMLDARKKILLIRKTKGIWVFWEWYYLSNMPKDQHKLQTQHLNKKISVKAYLRVPYYARAKREKLFITFSYYRLTICFL